MRRRRNPTPPGEYWGSCQIGKHKDKLVLSSLNLNENIPLKKIGKGHFAVAYQRLDMPDEVIIVTKDDTYDKTILAEAHRDAPDNPHLPRLIMRGTAADLTIRGPARGYEQLAVYTVPWYKVPLRKDDSPKAWAQYLDIKDCLIIGWGIVHASFAGRPYTEKARSTIHEGYAVADAVIECAQERRLAPKLVEALAAIRDTMANYGSSYVFEFAPRNLGTDSKGNLVLVDPLFDMEAIERDRAAIRAKLRFAR